LRAELGDAEAKKGVTNERKGVSQVTVIRTRWSSSLILGKQLDSHATRILGQGVSILELKQLRLSMGKAVHLALGQGW
jgi:hypothetical protein